MSNTEEGKTAVHRGMGSQLPELPNGACVIPVGNYGKENVSFSLTDPVCRVHVFMLSNPVYKVLVFMSRSSAQSVLRDFDVVHFVPDTSACEDTGRQVILWSGK